MLRSNPILRLLFAIFLLAWVVGASAFPVYADGSYKISNYDIHVELQEDGSALVEESITYAFNGSFNGVYYHLDTDKSGGIESPAVFVKTEYDLRPLEQNNSESQGTYQYSESGGYSKFKVFERSSDVQKTFVYRYRMLDAVTVYADTAEFNRKLIGTKWDVPINNVQVKVTLPEAIDSDQIKVFSHGPLTGESRILDQGASVHHVDLVPKGDFFEVRVLFPKDLVPGAMNRQDTPMLERILSQEAQLAVEANAARDLAKRQIEFSRVRRKIGNAVMPILILFWILGIVWNQRRLGRRPPGTFVGVYYRELPGDYAPTDLHFLMNREGSPSFKEIAATLMDLVRRDQLILHVTKSLKKGIFKSTEETDYVFGKKTIGFDFNQLTESEQYLVNWLFQEVEDPTRFSLSALKSYFTDRKRYKTIARHLSKWQM